MKNHGLYFDLLTVLRERRSGHIEVRHLCVISPIQLKKTLLAQIT